ncbi:benzoylformate decarboxylase [Coniochaeta sp. 2T2.1]|nr:benzoylformate decarboxylase [Coniochaeta sp. 2T2.1]
MPPTIIRSPPSVSDYVPLSDYQSQTPETFHGGKPVLHYHATGVLARVYRSQCDSLAFFANPSPLSFPEPSVDNPDEKCEQVVDLYINSENFTIYSPKAECGLSLPYPTITLHAISKIQNTAVDGGQEFPSVYLQLELSDGGEDDESYDTVELTLIPGPPTSPSSAANEPQPEETKKMFEAISECSNLNPDPLGDEDDDEDEYDKIVFEGDVEGREEIPGLPGVYASDSGLPPPMPGSSGWITAENVHEYFDAEGNWIGGEEEEEGVSGELGEGAGRVRGRDEVDAAEEKEVNGGKEEDGESKRVRTE